MLRLSVTPLPNMSSELTSHDPWDCCLLLAYVMCHVLRGAVVRGAWRSVFMRFFAR